MAIVIGVLGVAKGLAFLIVAYALWLIVILVHELGHLVTGLLLGMHLLRIRVGPLEFRRPGGMNRKLQWDGAHTGIVYLRAGRRAMKATALRLAVMYVAGPLANLGSAALAAVIYQRATQQTSVAGEFIALSVCATVGSLIPWRNKGMRTDGYQLCTLTFSTQGRERAVLQSTVAERLKQFRELYAAGSLQEVREALDILIRTFDLSPSLPQCVEAKAKLCGWRAAVEKAIICREQIVPETDAMVSRLTDMEIPSAVS